MKVRQRFNWQTIHSSKGNFPQKANLQAFTNLKTHYNEVCFYHNFFMKFGIIYIDKPQWF